MALKIRTIATEWRDVLVLASLVIALITFIAQSNRSSGKQEQSLAYIAKEQTEQNEAIKECKSEIKENKVAQDIVNVSVTQAINKNSNTNERVVTILKALLIDHAALMKDRKLYPHAPQDFDYQNGKPGSSSQKMQTADSRIGSSIQ